EDNAYYDLCNDFFMGHQARINVNANHPRAPTLVSAPLSANQHQLASNLTFPL
ncbi:28811_t:CDS:1, partial [Gigaspora margarita]